MSPSSQLPHPTYFKKIQSFSTDYSPTNLTQYESTRTGMTVVVVDQEGPIVHGSFALGTEIHDDSGAPHTLEHLCFMGSRNYRYKGVLDKLATRAYSDTNAYTSTDHTEYILDSAGWEGFAQILPVYLEHIIVPSLTDEACYTEVHHINGDGNDAGVVYSEMQARENTPDLLMFSKSKQLLYPEGVGFRYDTFGIMKSLRALTANRIRKYHQDTYQPRNLCVLIIGEIDHAELLSILDEFEGTILSDVENPSDPFRRPWIDSKQAPLLQASSTNVIEFPEEDETSGQISISFFGPAYGHHLLCNAMAVLLAYLAGSPASILENTLVEKEQVASAVMYEHDIQPTTAVHFILSSIVTDQLQAVEARFFEILREAAMNPLDMEYMHDCIKREKRQKKFYAESSGQFFTETILSDFLFGKRDGSTLRAELENLSDYDVLETWAESHWRHWLTAWLSEAPHVTVLGKPSAPLAEKLRSDEKVRIEARKMKLGEHELGRLRDRLASAKAESDREVPQALLRNFQIPSTESIHFIETTSARSGAARASKPLNSPTQNIIDDDEDLPLFIHFENIHSNFAYLTVVLGTQVVPIHLRPLLTLYMENFFSAPMLRDGMIVNFEQIITELERDTVSYDIDLGSTLGNSETIVLKVEVEVEKYETAIRWLKELMWFSVFDLERIKATTARLLADIPEDKRDGRSMVRSVELMVGTAPSSALHACNTLVKALYLKRIQHTLKRDPQRVIDQLKELSTAICGPSNFRVLVIADIKKLKFPVSSWKALTAEIADDKPLNPLETRLSRLSEQGKHPGNIAYVIPIPPVESSFILAVSKGPSSFGDEVLPALMVAVSYLNAVEGPLWTAVRGTGLAYATNLFRHIDSGQVTLEVNSAPDPVKAFAAIQKVVSSLVSGVVAFNPYTLEGAVSSLVLEFANAEATRVSAAQSSFVRQVMQGLPKDWPNEILERVKKIETEEVREAMEQMVLPLFEARATNLFITCAPSMEKEVAADLENIGFRPDVKPLIFFQDDYGLKGEEAADEESNDEERTEDEESEENGEDDDLEYNDYDIERPS